jgi:hypothetical protein
MEKTAAERYARLTSNRTQFLDAARECARLSVPYIMPPSGHYSGSKLWTPWQAVGAKGVNVMASKLMLSLFPVSTKFFKLQISDGALAKDPDVDAQARSEIDLVLSKMERVVMQHVNESTDRTVLHQAMKHLVVTGNVLLYMGKKGIKLYPMDRYVVVRDGEGSVTEIVTVEAIDRQFLPKSFFKKTPEQWLKERKTGVPEPDNATGDEGAGSIADLKLDPMNNEVAVYTWAKLQDGQWRWHQEADDRLIPGTESVCPKNTPQWLPLRFNVVDGEDWGRGRIEEYLGDLKSLESLSQAIVEGSAAAAKVIFTVSPSATTKPNQLAQAGSGAIIQGRPDDVGVIQVGKTADFKTAYDMITLLTQRLSEAFLVLTVRQSERTTAEEIRATQQELNEQLGGIYGSLTTDLLRPYINRKLVELQRQRMLPKFPKDMVFPTVVAGLEGVGRGQDREALMLFMQTIAQTLGPEVMANFLNPTEAIKRLAASAGIDYLGLIKTEEELAQESQAQQQAQQQQSMLDQMGQLAGAPIMDPSKNPAILDTINAQQQQEGEVPGGLGFSQGQSPPGAQLPDAGTQL